MCKTRFFFQISRKFQVNKLVIPIILTPTMNSFLSIFPQVVLHLALYQTYFYIKAMLPECYYQSCLCISCNYSFFKKKSSTFLTTCSSPCSVHPGSTSLPKVLRSRCGNWLFKTLDQHHSDIRMLFHGCVQVSMDTRSISGRACTSMPFLRVSYSGNCPKDWAGTLWQLATL